jgi:hypothetical protein
VAPDVRRFDPRVPLWGAPRIHGELLKLGIDIGQTSLANYMARRGALRHKAGGHSSSIMPTGLPRSIYS